jgi:hypothetical protein
MNSNLAVGALLSAFVEYMKLAGNVGPGGTPFISLPPKKNFLILENSIELWLLFLKLLFPFLPI